ncbi:MAG TPA: DUF2156 domain-containing protein [Nakamurella multipartita]|nr:DUF2156 domain-containing protein [Nakamurella multipartita]
MTPVENGGTPTTSVSPVAPDRPAEPAEPATPRPTPTWLRLVKRLPFTTSYVVITVVLAVVLGTLWTTIEDKSWYDDVAFGLPAFEDGRWLTLIWGMFFALDPFFYVYVAGAFALITGFSEWRLGTARTVLICVLYQWGAVLITALIFLIFRNSGWEWVQARAAETDVGFSAGMLAAVSVASATVRPPWRLRLRLAIWGYVLFSVLFVGQMADAEHFVAVMLSMPFSTRLAGPHALRARALPTRHELRLLAAIGVLVIATLTLLANLLPDRLTPLGPSQDTPESWWVLIIELALFLFVANGLRRGYRWAWWCTVILCSLIVVFALLVGLIAILLAFDPGAGDLDIDGGLPEFFAQSLLYLVYMVMLIAGRGAFRVPRRSKRRLASGTSHADTAKDLLRRWGGDTISWMTTWPENRHMITADGQGYLAFRKHAGVAVALGDPVGPPGATAGIIDDFIAMCDKAALVPYIFSCSRTTTEVTDGLGWSSAQVAEDNLIDLPTLEFKGKKWQDVRTALNKAPKEGVSFRMVSLADEPWSMVRQVEELSQQWLGDKELPEMGFTLGGVTEALDREVKVGLAVGADGKLHGVTSWMPVFGPEGHVRGWTLDLMRRADGGFRSTMEFLIASSCLWFKKDGAEFVSLSGAPLARSAADADGETPVEKFLDTLGEQLEPVYGFRSLHAFKGKFQPRFSPMYMAFRDEADLPRIGIAITRAYLPTAGLRDMISVVKH